MDYSQSEHSRLDRNPETRSEQGQSQPGYSRLDRDQKTGSLLDPEPVGLLEGRLGALRGGSGWIEWNPDPLSGSSLDIISRCF